MFCGFKKGVWPDFGTVEAIQGEKEVIIVSCSHMIPCVKMHSEVFKMHSTHYLDIQILYKRKLN